MSANISFEKRASFVDDQWALSIKENGQEPLILEEYVLSYDETKIANDFPLYIDFGYLTTVNRLYLPRNVKDITAFCGVNSKEIIIDEENPYLISIDGVVYTKDKKELVLYPRLKGGSYEIPEGTEILREHGFAYSVVNKVVFPESIREMQRYSFHMCKELEYVKLNQGLETIDANCFEGCFKLKSISVPNSVYNMDYRTFRRCYELHDIEINTETTILFYDHNIIYGDGHKDFLTPKGIYNQFVTDMESRSGRPPEEWILIAIKSCINQIASYSRKLLAKANATEMKQISDYLSDIVSKRDKAAHSEKKGDTGNFKIKTLKDGRSVIDKYTGKSANVVLPAAIDGQEISGIGEFAFTDNDYIEHITVPEGYISIGRRAFKDCVSLKTVKLPASVHTIGNSVFEHCINLEEITVPVGVEKIPGCCFKGCSSLRKMVIPDSVLEIGNEALSECTALDDIVLPKNLTRIGNEAFSGSGIDHGPLLEGEWGYSFKEIEIPDTVESIGNRVFAGYPKAEELFGVFEYKVKLIVKKNTCGHRYAVKNKIRFTLK